MTPLLLNLRIAVSALRHAWRRNLLALTGLAVGIAAVVAMLGLTLIVRQEALRQFDRSGLDVLAIRKTSTTSPSTARRPPQIEAATLRHLAAAVPALDLIAPLMERRGTLGFNGRTSQATVLGVTESFLELNALEAAEGRLLTDLDHAEPYVVIGRDLAGNLRGGVGTPLIGRQLQVEGRVLTIVGVLAPARAIRLHAGDLNQVALVPAETFGRIVDGAEISVLYARHRYGPSPAEVIADTIAALQSQVEGLSLQATSAAEWVAEMQRQLRLFTLLLGATGSIALILGGTGIMNGLLMAVTERRNEIGLRRALGALRGGHSIAVSLRGPDPLRGRRCRRRSNGRAGNPRDRVAGSVGLHAAARRAARRRGPGGPGRRRRRFPPRLSGRPPETRGRDARRVRDSLPTFHPCRSLGAPDFRSCWNDVPRPHSGPLDARAVAVFRSGSTCAPMAKTKPVLLVASGDLRQSANETCWPAQHAMEQSLAAAVAKLGARLVRAHPYKPALKHGFIGSQKEGMEVFATVDPDAPLIVAEAVWQYSHHVLAGPDLASRADPDRRQLERHLAGTRGHAEPERLAHQGGREVLDALERGLHRCLFPEGPAVLAHDRRREASHDAREAARANVGAPEGARRGEENRRRPAPPKVDHGRVRRGVHGHVQRHHPR
jgi:putative ABC transport system permease protein